MSQDKQFVWKSHWKTAWLGLKVVCGRASGNQSPGWGKDCEPGWWRRRYGAHLPVCWGRAQQRNNCLSLHLCLGESCPSSSCPDTKQFSSSWHVPGVVFQGSRYCSHAGAQRELVWISPCMGPLRRTASDSTSFNFPQSQSPLVFTARSYRDFPSWHWNSGLGTCCGVVTPCFSWGPPQLSYPSGFLSLWVWDQSIPHLPTAPHAPTYLSWCGFLFNSVVVRLHSAWYLVVLNDGYSVVWL